MNKTVLMVGVVVILAVAGGAFYMNSTKTAPQPTDDITAMQAEPTQTTTDTTTMEAEPTTAAATDEAAVKEFTVTGSNFAFDPKEITVKKGDKVKIIFKNSGGTHDFVLDEFNAKTQKLEDGEEETIEFTADKAGTFEYYCSVGKHREMGMVGNLIVE